MYYVKKLDIMRETFIHRLKLDVFIDFISRDYWQIIRGRTVLQLSDTDSHKVYYTVGSLVRNVR
jgi:hypothetical protein